MLTLQASGGTKRVPFFTSAVDKFGVNYVVRQHDEHLIYALATLYTITTDLGGKLHCGLNLNWYHNVRCGSHCAWVHPGSAPQISTSN